MPDCVALIEELLSMYDTKYTYMEIEVLTKSLSFIRGIVRGGGGDSGSPETP